MQLQEKSASRGIEFLGWRFSPTLWPTMATLLVLPVLLYLGIWQYGRAETKEQLLNQYNQRTIAPAKRLTADVARSVQDHLFRKVRLTGRYDSSRQFLLDNRTHSGRAGYEVYSVFETTIPGLHVLVNRGWIPVGDDRTALPDLTVPMSDLEIEGLFANPPRPGLVLGATGYQERIWPRVVQLVDFEEMESAMKRGLMRVVVLLSPDEAHGFVREWQPFTGIGAQRHQGYALQWFSLALALIIIYLVLNLRRIPTSSHL